ncbi:MAG: hypothetical protein K2O62_00720, partial [Clostridia bacterium]|nr:hypothetical protein [Clostridia bacterium]
ALSSYIVTPSKVGWQMAESIAKNDPAFTGKEGYPTDWTNDKIWLPSIYEVSDNVMAGYDAGIGSSFTSTTNGGLWKINDDMTDNGNSQEGWLRTAQYDCTDLVFAKRINGNGVNQTISFDLFTKDILVRPALHLNLTKALENAVVYAPTNLPNFTYDGKSKWLSDLTGDDVPKWYDSEIYGNNTTYMSVKSTMYEDKLGNAAQSVAVTNIKAAGTYTVTMTLKSGYQWDDKSTGDKSFKIIIDKSAPNVSADFVDTNVKKGIYATYNNCTLPELKNTAANATPGTFAWKSGQQPTGPNGFKTTPYEWEFTPDASNINNYDTATGTISINYKTQSVSSLEIIVDDGAQFYDAFTLTDGTYSIKNYITVNGVYQDGITKELVQPEDYTLSLPKAASLTAGTVTIRAKRTSDNKTGDKDITVIASQVMELQAEYDDGGTHLTYSENLTNEDLKTNLTVTAKWNYSGFDFLPVANKDVTITGTLAAGAAPLTMTATYGGQTSNFYPVIDKGTLDISSVKLNGNGTGHTYDGTAQKIEATGDVKDPVSKQVMSGVNFVYTYTKNGQTVAGAAESGVTDAGVYTVTLTFTHSNPNYNEITATREA